MGGSSMILNYHTLHRWAEETAAGIVQSKIIELFSQAKDVLNIGIVTPSRQPCAIEISAEKEFAHIVLRKDYRRKSKNSADLFHAVIGQKIESIQTDVNDRIVRIALSGGWRLEAEFFGSVNIFLVDQNNKIIDTFKDSKDHTGRVREKHVSKAVHEMVLTDTDSLQKQIKTTEEFKTKLSEGLAHFNKYLAMECFQHSGSLHECFAGLKDMLRRLRTEKPRIYWLHEEPKLFSLISLTHYRKKHPALREEIFESVNEAVQAYISQKTAFRLRDKKLQDLLRGIRIRIKKNEALAGSLREEKTEAEDYEASEQKAHLLNVHISELKRGMHSITVEDIYDSEQKTVEIELNPEWTPQRNIEQYFSQSKKMKLSVKKIEERIRVLDSETMRLKTMLIELEQAENKDWKKIDKIYEEFVRAGWIKKASVETRTKLEKEPPVFREFIVAGNWRVWVGQNDTKNDQLTFKFAKGDDYWFHARGVPGSHVVLKRDGRKENPGKQAIETAASIAAFFSKAKSSSLVPVAYTLKKYVRKPKGSRPGQVIIEREEVVIVPPREMK